DDRAQFAADGVRPIPHGGDAALDVGDLTVRRTGLQHDDHLGPPARCCMPLRWFDAKKAAGSSPAASEWVIAAGVRSARGSLNARSEPVGGPLGSKKIRTTGS